MQHDHQPQQQPGTARAGENGRHAMGSPSSHASSPHASSHDDMAGMAMMPPPQPLEESFATPAAAAERLAGLASGGRLAGHAMLHAAPSNATIEAAFPPRMLRGMLWGAILGGLAGVLLGLWLERATGLSGSWGGLLAAGPHAMADGFGLALGGLGLVLGGLAGFRRLDPVAARMPHATLMAMVRPDGDPAGGMPPMRSMQQPSSPAPPRPA